MTAPVRSLPEKLYLGFSRLFSTSAERIPASRKILTPFIDAVEELERRQADPQLRKKVEEYLGGDIPPHFSSGPILYLARHLATPNFETLRFLHIVEPMDIPAVIGQDTQDKFVPNNQLKKALGKPSVANGISSKGGKYHEQFVNTCVIDFNTANGKALSEVKTHTGESLAGFHSRLFKHVCKRAVQIVDDSNWISRHHRGEPLKHYKKFFALFLVHGILFEDVELDEDREFVDKILVPAFRHVERHFGLRPLLTQLTPTAVESSQFWVSYPKEAMEIIKEHR